MGILSRRHVAYWLGAVVVSLALVSPAGAAPPLEVTKTVAHVNEDAPPVGEIVSVSSGDTVGYAIAVSGNPSFGGTDVTITDVFDASVITFEAASTGGCVAQAGTVSCTVQLADTGDTEVVLSFRVLDVGDCQELVNRVDVSGERHATGSAEATIEACPLPGGVLAGTPPADTALIPSGFGFQIPLVALGSVAVFTAAVITIRLVGRSRRS